MNANELNNDEEDKAIDEDDALLAKKAKQRLKDLKESEVVLAEDAFKAAGWH